MQSYLDHLAALEHKETAERQSAQRMQQKMDAMSYEKLAECSKINLCDPAQEPSDEDLARLMDCVAQEAVKRNEKAARVLSNEIDREIANALGRMA